MNLFSKLGKLFTSGKMPDEAKSAFESSKDTRELLAKLDSLSTRNEVEMKSLEKEMLKIDEIEDVEADKIRAGSLSSSAKKLALMQIKRLWKKRSNLEDRLNIYDRNINLHLNLIGKIQSMEAMQLGGVEPDEIDSVMIEFEENFETYTEAIRTAEEFASNARKIDEQDKELKRIEQQISGGERQKEQDKELLELENEILGKKSPKDEKDEPQAESDEGMAAE